MAEALPRVGGDVTVMMFVHPRCPCTPASLTEFARVLKNKPINVRAQIVFFSPLDANAAWTTGAVWEQAKGIEGAEVVLDRGGALAQRSTARTSGQVIVYGSQGEVLFEGGVTAGRGMAGDSAGARSLAQALRGEPISANHTPVYGCSLESPGETPESRTGDSSNQDACPECTPEGGA